MEQNVPLAGLIQALFQSIGLPIPLVDFLRGRTSGNH